ncbi:hypothetical protein NRS6120_12995 [Bacillus subtilis]|nr:hypothetical protein NRS6120_01918 [Bacillus subtilis]CAI6283875.1 hypothetical protein NRS6120_12995 [Bacillus subtilis]
MLSKHNPIQRDQLEMITLNQLVPASHLVRKIEAALDFSFIYDLSFLSKRKPFACRLAFYTNFFHDIAVRHVFREF